MRITGECPIKQQPQKPHIHKNRIVTLKNTLQNATYVHHIFDNQ